LETGGHIEVQRDATRDRSGHINRFANSSGGNQRIRRYTSKDKM
jgi:hypothetical protein